MSIYIEDEENKWWINKAPSIFTNRKGKQDVSIYKRSAWGRRNPDGKLYKCCVRLCAEDGAIVRSYENIPSWLTIDFLRDKGFISGHSNGHL